MDDVADTDKYWKIFKGQRMIHIDDSKDFSHYEKFFEGQDDIFINDELIAIPTPGHTKGSVCFLYKGKISFFWRSSGLFFQEKKTYSFYF